MGIFDQQWWNENVARYGLTAAAAHQSEWSTARRFRFLRSILSEQAVVMDVGSGVGLLNLREGPFRRYFAVDFSQKALDLCSADGKLLASLPDDLDKVVEFARLNDVDWTVCCGLTTGSVFHSGIRRIVEPLYEASRVGLVVNFRNSLVIQEEGLFGSAPGVVLEDLSDLCPSLDQHVLPHEFFIVLKHDGWKPCQP